MVTSGVLNPTGDAPSHIDLPDSTEQTRSDLTLLQAYARREITLGELIRRRREELGLTRIQVLELSGYRLYRSHELEALENDELKSVHDIWFTILYEPLRLDYNQFWNAHRRVSPTTNSTPKQPVQVIDEDMEELKGIRLPDISAIPARKSRSCGLSSDWLTRQALAKLLGTTSFKAESFARRMIASEASLSRMVRVVAMGKTKSQTLYHRKLARQMLQQLRLQEKRSEWLSLPQLARMLKAKPEEVETVIQQLISEAKIAKFYRWQTISSRGMERVLYHPNLPTMLQETLRRHQQKQQWLSRSRVAIKSGSTAEEVDELAQLLIRIGASAEHHRRVIGQRQGTEKVQYHPDLAQLIIGRFDEARQKRKAAASLKKEQQAELIAQRKKTLTEAKQQAAEQRRKDLAKAKLQAAQKRQADRLKKREAKLLVAQEHKEGSQTSREIRRRHKNWLDRAQLAKTLGVSVEVATHAAYQVLGLRIPATTHPQMELLFPPELVEQISKILQSSNQNA